MSEYKILKQVKLGSAHINSGKTKHIVAGKIMPNPVKLQIITFPMISGFYLLYLDSNEEALTDTYHESIEEALDQANWEFNVKPNEWD